MESTILKEVLKTGFLGIFLIIEGVVIYSLYKDLKSERDARLIDMKAVWQEDIKFRTELKSLLDSILDILKKGG
jgi:hypothetical protein